MKFLFLFILTISVLIAQPNRSELINKLLPPDSDLTDVSVRYLYKGSTQPGIQQVVRKVILEEGTNTSCGYCAQYNPGIHEFMGQHPDSLVNITYHVYWPGNNDPMYQANTTQIAQRINYMGINAVPRVDIDGIQKDVWPLSPSSLNSVFDLRQLVLTDVDVTVVDQYIENDSIKAVITVDIFQELPDGDYKLRIYALDRKIVYKSPPGNNGEKEFEFVFRRGYPNMTGITLPKTSGSHEYTVTYPIEQVWGTGLIYTVAFVQNDSNREILNGDMSNFYYKPQPAALDYPLNLEVTEYSSVTLGWHEAVNGSYYRLEVAEDDMFTEMFHYSNAISETYYNLGELGESTKLYWRVKTFSDSDSALYSETRSFITPLVKPYNLEGELLSDRVKLNWEDNSSAETNYFVERAVTQGIGIVFHDLDTIPANSTTYDDIDISGAGIYYYRVRAINDISFSSPSDSVMYNLKVGVEENNTQVTIFSLAQNYPNPFNPSTKISFTIPSEDIQGNTKLVVYDMLGNEISVLFDQKVSAGEYSIEFSPENISSGVYIYKLTSGKYSMSRKFVYLK